MSGRLGFALAILLFQLVVHRMFVLNALTLFAHSLVSQQAETFPKFFSPALFLPHFTARTMDSKTTVPVKFRLAENSCRRRARLEIPLSMSEVARKLSAYFPELKPGQFSIQ